MLFQQVIENRQKKVLDRFLPIIHTFDEMTPAEREKNRIKCNKWRKKHRRKYNKYIRKYRLIHGRTS